jgi:predicted Rossmann fold nucleotide-binding protein DprA/Smf involved in DNA uptake
LWSKPKVAVPACAVRDVCAVQALSNHEAIQITSLTDLRPGSTNCEAVAFFCSRSCPGDIILKAQDWANARAANSASIFGGFHTPVEREVLRVLLRSHASTVIVLARAAKGWRVPQPLGPAIRGAVAAGRAHIVSFLPDSQLRTTAASAESRNRHILTLVDTIMIAHASPGGKTEALAREAVAKGLKLFTLPSKHNANLIALGAIEERV